MSPLALQSTTVAEEKEMDKKTKHLAAPCKRRESLEYREGVWGYAFIAPMLIGFLIITVAPVIAAFVYSMTNKNMMSRTTDFVGLANYGKLFRDKTFRSTMLQTLEFTVLLIPSNLVLTLALAVLLKEKFRGCGFFRTAVFTPVVTSVVVWGVLWRYLFQADNGLINAVLRMMGISGPQWLMNTKLAIPITVFITLVKGLGMNMVMFIGAMLDVPQDYYEAASLDGASKWRQFFSITLPNIAPTIFLVLIMTTIGSLKVFGQIKALSNGGPGTASYVMVFYIYEMAFKNYKFGYASAASVVLFLMIVTLTILQWMGRKKWVYHED